MEKAYFTGESLGGWVTAQLAIDHPDRVERIVLNTMGGTMANPQGDGAALHAVHGGGEGPAAGSGSRPGWSG